MILILPAQVPRLYAPSNGDLVERIAQSWECRWKLGSVPQTGASATLEYFSKLPGYPGQTSTRPAAGRSRLSHPHVSHCRAGPSFISRLDVKCGERTAEHRAAEPHSLPIGRAVSRTGQGYQDPVPSAPR